jgi:hypothetical protein
VVSGSNLSPYRYCLIGILSNSSAPPWPKYGSDGNTCRSGTRPKKPNSSCIFSPSTLQVPSVRSVGQSRLGAGERGIPSANGKLLDPWRIDAKRVCLSGECLLTSLSSLRLFSSMPASS